MSNDEGETEITQEYLQSLSNRIAEEDRDLAVEVVEVLNRAKTLRDELEKSQRQVQELRQQLQQIDQDSPSTSDEAETEDSDQEAVEDEGDSSSDSSDEEGDTQREPGEEQDEDDSEDSSEQDEGDDGSDDDGQTDEEESEDEDDDEEEDESEIDIEEVREEAREDARDETVTEVMEDLFIVRDNLVRGLEQAPEDSNIKAGVEATLTQLDGMIEEWGVEVIDPTPGDEVDPEEHKVVERVAGDQSEDSIEEVYRQGYKRDEFIMRSAEVAVSEDVDEQSEDD